MSIKQNAESMEDKTIYFEIKYVDLIAKELRYHRHCYKEFTRKKSEKLLNVNETQKGDYQKVKDIIEKLVLNQNQNQAVSMANIHNAYALHPNDTRYRSKLKERIENDYTKQLLFVKVKNNSPDVVISSKALDSHLILNENEVLLKEAAVILRNDILDYLNKMSEVAWPPDIENLASDDELPNQVTMFLENLLKPTGKPLTEKLTRFINSFASDFVSSIGGGKITTAKHFLVALGLHNLTGQKKVVQILHKLGHCMNYDLTCGIETSQARLALEQQSSSSTLPLLPKNNDNYVLTYFWVDNVDKLVGLMQGGGPVHSTHLVAFQEQSPYSMKNSQKKYFSRQKNER